MSSIPTVEHRNQGATCYVGNLDPTVDEDLLMELFNHVGRVSSVHMPKDKLTSGHNGYGFVEYRDVADADYAIQVLSMIKLYGRPLRVSKSSLDKKSLHSLDVGANLFLGNLDPDVDEKLVYDTFSAFGNIIRPPKVMREEDSGQSKGYGFVSYDSFEASDMAIECMHEQYLCNRQVTVQYAFKKSSNNEETGQAPGSRPERHGSRAERMLAASNPMRKNNNNNNLLNNNALMLGNNNNNPALAAYQRPTMSYAAGTMNTNTAMALPSTTTTSMPFPPVVMPPPPLPPLPQQQPTMGVTAGAAATTTMMPPPLPPGYPPMATTTTAAVASMPPPPPLPPMMDTTTNSSINGGAGVVPPPLPPPLPTETTDGDAVAQQPPPLPPLPPAPTSY